MADKLITPPLNKMVREQPTPNHANGFFSEVVSKESNRYQAAYPIKRGTRYSSLIGGDPLISASFDPLYFLKEIRFGTSDELVIFVWATNPEGEDSYNASIEFSGESVAAPVFTRVYNVLRDRWDAGLETLVTLTPLTALIAIRVTAGGTGYTTATITIGGPGSGASAQAVIAGGVITSIIVTDSGTGFVTAPAITITGDGAAAAATGIIQPQTALLVKQFKQELSRDSSFTTQSADSPFSNVFVRVVRVYETLPGPILTSYDHTPDRNSLITITRRRVATGTAVGAGGNGVVTSLEAIDTCVSLLTTKTYEEPDTFTFGDALAFAFPSIYLGFYEHGNRAYPYFREGFSQLVAANIEVTYDNAPFEPALTAGGFREARWSFPSGFNGVALTDENAVSYPTDAGTFSANLPASFPPKATYLALIGTDIVVDFQNREWYGGLWEIRKTTVRMR